LQKIRNAHIIAVSFWVKGEAKAVLPRFIAGSFYMPINEELYEGQRQSIRTDQAISTNPLPKLTAQEQMLVAALNAGASIAEAARRAGMSPQTASKWLKNREDLQQAMTHYRDEFQRDILPNVVFTKDDAHHMYMTAYRNSANATEQIKATDSLVKLHRLNEPEKREAEKEVNTAKQLEHYSVNELLKLAGYKLSSLNPEDIEDGEVTDGS
jgi:transcriptional regulator with XRE-family HTH domain